MLFVFFAYVVLPLFGKEAASRARQVRNDWAIAATVYTVALTALLPALTFVLV